MTLSPNEWTALSREIDAAASLIRRGFVVLDDYNFAARDLEPLFVCFAGGAEKLLKLTVGLVAIDAGEPWPTTATMKKAGHKITQLDATVRRHIVERQERSTVPGLIAKLLEIADSHPGIVQSLAAFERYADSGRFYNLDMLGGLAQTDESPSALWSELETHIVLDANPDLLDEAEAGNHDFVRATLNRVLARSLGIWCELIQRSWTSGVCGELAKQWSSQLDLGHPEPPRLAGT